MLNSSIKTHDEIPGLVFVSNVGMRNIFSNEFYATESEVIKLIREKDFPMIPIEDFHAILNPYFSSTWSVYVEAKHKLNVDAWHDSIIREWEILKQVTEERNK